MARDASALWSAYAAGGADPVAAEATAVEGRTYVVTWVAGFVDEDALLTIKGGAAGATTMLELSQDISVNGFNLVASGFELVGIAGVKVAAAWSTSSSDSAIAFGGYYV